jgi:predicted Zn-dependent peptidase
LHHTTLPNGLLVSSQETYGQVGTLALFIEAGSMYEAPDEVGACHFFETTAFKNTEGLSPDEIMALTLTKGLTTSAVFNREVLLFKVDLLRANVDDATRLIAEAVMRPKLSDADLEDGEDLSRV